MYRAKYINSVFAGTMRDGGLIGIVAGSHSQDFPYAGDQPWDNVLLLIGDGCFEQTVRNPGLVQFEMNPDPKGRTEAAGFKLEGLLRRVGTTEQVPVHITIDMSLGVLPAKELGVPCNALHYTNIPGMHWQPFVTQTAHARIGLGGRELECEHLGGEIEFGRQFNLRNEMFAFYYDYQALVSPHSPGCAYVRFQTHALSRTAFGRILDRYLVRYASEELTVVDGTAHDGDLRGLRLRENEIAVEFENSVKLRLSVLRRQFVTCRDQNQKLFIGLREIFQPCTDSGVRPTSSLDANRRHGSAVLP